MKHLAVMVWLTFLCAAIGLTLAKPASAATYTLNMKDGTRYYVEAPHGATTDDLIKILNSQIAAGEIEYAEGTRRKEEPRPRYRADLMEEHLRELGRLAQEEENQRRKDNPGYYEKLAEEAADREELYRNCIVDKMAGVTEKTAQAFVRDSCNKISIDPSLYQKWKYSD